VCDVVVIILDLAERLFVLLHQVIDVVVLAFLNLKNLDLNDASWLEKLRQTSASTYLAAQLEVLSQ